MWPPMKGLKLVKVRLYPYAAYSSNPTDMSAMFFIMMLALFAGRTEPASKRAKPPCIVRIPIVRAIVQEWSPGAPSAGAQPSGNFVASSPGSMDS